MKKKYGSFTHEQYRKAKVIHLVNMQKREEFVYEGKEISKTKAIAITKAYMDSQK